MDKKSERKRGKGDDDNDDDDDRELIVIVRGSGEDDITFVSVFSLCPNQFNCSMITMIKLCDCYNDDGD